MDIRQLQYFLAITEEESITHAAERLHMAQPPLSKQLKLLENELGVTLLERNTRRLRLTDAGRHLAYRARQILELTETTIKELRDFDDIVQGTLVIGTIASAGDTLLPMRIAQFHRQYPRINFQVKERSTPEILDMLKNGLVDIGIVRTPIPYEQYHTLLLPDEPMVAATSNPNFWSENPAAIQLKDLEGHPLLVHNRYEEVITEICRHAGFEPRILGKIDDTRSILLWASTGLGIAIIQRDWLELLAIARLHYKELDEPSLITRTAVIWMKDRYLSSAARHFLQLFP